MRLALILALLSTFGGCHELSPKQKAARRHMVAVSTKGPMSKRLLTSSIGTDLTRSQESGRPRQYFGRPATV